MINQRQLRAVQKAALGIAAQSSALAELIGALIGPEDEEQPQDPACPNCGSPNYSDLSGMGPEKEFQCKDCGTHYAP